jgi:exonuclease VII small subunit
MTPAADERIQRLYGLPLELFTTERNALAAQLRAEGDGEAAARVKSLRKPSAAAWAVNQLVRSEPDLLEALLGAGGELRQAHRQAASGRGSAQLRAAAEAERSAVERLMARAPSVLGRPLTAALADSMRNSLHAASSDDDARERVRTGTLETELRPIGLGPIPAGATGGARPSRRAAAREKRPSDTAVRRAATAAREAKAEAAEQARLRRAAAAEEAALQRELDAAVRALDRAEESYARAREAADAAAERMKDARKRMREARSALADSQRRRARLEADS